MGSMGGMRLRLGLRGRDFSGTPDGGVIQFGHVVAQPLLVVLTGSADGAVFHEDGSVEGLKVFAGVGEGGECGSPGDVAMAGGVVSVAAFGEDPFGAVMNFAEGEEVGGDVVMVFGEVFLGGGELVHEGEAEVVLPCGEVDFLEAVGALVGGFPANLTAESGLVAGSLDAGNVVEEVKEDGSDEVPVFGATGEECAEPEVVGAGFVDVKGCEVAGAGGGNIKSQAELGI